MQDKKWDFNFECSHRGRVLGEVECGCATYDPFPLAECGLYDRCTPVTLSGDRGWKKKAEEYEIHKRPAACSTCLDGRRELLARLRSENKELYRKHGE